MEKNEVIAILMGLSVKTVVSWAVVLSSIAAAIGGFSIKLYKLFEKIRAQKEKDEYQENEIRRHNELLENMNIVMNEMRNSLNEQKDVNLKQIRHTIVHTCEEALEKGEISINKLRSLEEMYEEYVDIFHGNGYVKTLVLRVRKLKITGKIDE